MNRSYAILILIGCAFLSSVRGQTPSQDDIQSWNDIQLTVPMDEHFEFYTAVTARFGKNVTRLNDGRYAIGFGWKPTKALNIMPFYWYIRMRNSAGSFRTEHRLNLRATYRFPIKSFGLSHRSTYEYRLRNPANSRRYRAAMTVEKDLPKSWIPSTKIYATDEIFYDSLLKQFSRNRITVGVNKTLKKNLSLDIYYMRQNDGFSRPGDLNVIGTTWRVKM
jgi:hypothetical protein